MATSQVHTAVTRSIVSQVYIPHIASGGYVHTSRGHVTTFRAYNPNSGMYIPTSGAYLPTYGVSHGASHAMDPIMGPSMDRVLHLMEKGIKNLLILLITAL